MLTACVTIVAALLRVKVVDREDVDTKGLPDTRARVVFDAALHSNAAAPFLPPDDRERGTADGLVVDAALPRTVFVANEAMLLGAGGVEYSSK